MDEKDFPMSGVPAGKREAVLQTQVVDYMRPKKVSTVGGVLNDYDEATIRAVYFDPRLANANETDRDLVHSVAIEHASRLENNVHTTSDEDWALLLRKLAAFRNAERAAAEKNEHEYMLIMNHNFGRKRRHSLAKRKRLGLSKKVRFSRSMSKRRRVQRSKSLDAFDVNSFAKGLRRQKVRSKELDAFNIADYERALRRQKAREAVVDAFDVGAFAEKLASKKKEGILKTIQKSKESKKNAVNVLKSKGKMPGRRRKRSRSLSALAGKLSKVDKLREARIARAAYRDGWDPAEFKENIKWATGTTTAEKARMRRRGGYASVMNFGESKDVATPEQLANRALLNFTGRGDYKSWAKYIPRGIGAIAGGALGYMEGGIPALYGGAKSGWNRGADFSKFIGLGDYSTVYGNQIAGADNQSKISVNSMNASGDIYISQTEYLGNVIVSGTGGSASTFAIRKYEINPGLSITFPFLSQIANNYELYSFQGLMFQYKPLAGEDTGTGINLGKVIMCTNYDPDSADFATSYEMQCYDYAQSAKPSVGMVHGVETHPDQCAIDLMYVRNGASTKAKNWTDPCNFYIATEGIPIPGSGAQLLPIGELWVTYNVRLSRAKLFGTVAGRDVEYYTGRLRSTASQLYDNTQAITIDRACNIPLTFTANGATSFFINFGQTHTKSNYFVQVVHEASSATAAVFLAFSRPAGSTYSFYMPGLLADTTNSAGQRTPLSGGATNTSNQVQIYLSNCPIQTAFSVQVAMDLNPGIGNVFVTVFEVSRATNVPVFS